MTAPPVSEPRYSPHRRTALVLTGSGTAGAYHAGVLRALEEAGVKVDLVAGRGIGVVGALFVAVDGAAQLWERTGLWVAPGAARLYRWRPALMGAVSVLGVALGVFLVPLSVVVLASLVYPVAYFVRVIGFDREGRLTTGFGRLIEMIFAPAALPIWLPRVIVLAMAALMAMLVGAAVTRWLKTRPPRRAHGALWWLLLGSPLDGDRVRGWFGDGLWKLVRGASAIKRPNSEDFGRRYTRLLSENLGQPGFRELLVTVHDLDGRRDLVFALLAEPFRRRFFRRRSVAPGERQLEALDLTGRASRHGFDVLAASVSLPVATEPWLVRFAPGSGWRGETHRLCDRPEAVGRLLDEVAHAGAEQIIFVSALPEAVGPQSLDVSRRDPVGRLGESWTSWEETAVRDALAARRGLFQQVFEIRPSHNPLGPFDFRGGYDGRSDRVWTVDELIERGYDDGHRQFIGSVFAASGEQISSVGRGRQD